MCGIAGILRVHPPGAAAPPPEVAIPEAWLDILDESIKHRGPDGQGRFRDRAVRGDGTVVDVALVHRRMAIIDLTDGAQPMVWSGGRLAPEKVYGTATVRERTQASGSGTVPLPDGRGSAEPVAVVFNGCIYNHRDLRRELQAAGHEFSTDHSDTEVLVHGWRAWGPELPKRLNGMFAYLVWDSKRGELFAARDRFGEKPLYFACSESAGARSFALCSSVVGLARLPPEFGEIRPARERVNRVGLGYWIRFGYGAVLPDKAVGQVWHGRAGSAPETPTGPLSAGMPKYGWWRRWDTPTGVRRHQPPAVKIDELIGRAVATRLEADVPVGCFLSGGVDSCLMAAHAHKYRPDLRAYTVRMPDPRFDESAAAALVAKHIGISHTMLDCDARPAEDLPRLIHQIGLPFGDSSLLPAYWVSRAAARHVKVALSGDGADELFGGYRRYRAAHLLGRMGPLRHLGWLARPFVKDEGDPTSVATRRRRFVEAATSEGYHDLLSIFPKRMCGQLGLPKEPVGVRAWKAAFGLVGDVISPFHEWLTRFRVGMAMAADLSSYLPEDILRKTDSASMSVPIEVRAPFLDRELATVAMQTRAAWLMRRGELKGLLREVARMHLPAEIVDRPKQGFAIPIGEWFRTDYGGMKQLLLDHLNSKEPWGPPSLGIDLNMRFVRQMLDEHMGTGMSGRVKRDHSQRLYMLLVLSIWAKWFGSVQVGHRS